MKLFVLEAEAAELVVEVEVPLTMLILMGLGITVLTEAMEVLPLLVHMFLLLEVLVENTLVLQVP